jgi:NADH dehydrogenase [ubiquinone] 1 alpha subcomplex assembly factor 7
MFGELIGLWLAQVWMDQGAPGDAILVELGPGRGTLMADALRATRNVPGLHAAMKVHLIEASPHLREVQSETLAPHTPTFHDTLATLPEKPVFAIANEFFDALPIRQFQRATGPALARARRRPRWRPPRHRPHAPPHPLAALEHRLTDTSPGMIVETCAPAEAIATDLGRRIADHGGAALVIDYGESDSIGDTFQAVASHEMVDPFADPGQADLTAHVAFGPLARAARPAMASPLVPQGVFLERLGITGRARTLAAKPHGPGPRSAHRRTQTVDARGRNGTPL